MLTGRGKGRRWAPALAVLMLPCCATPAGAHPHVFITSDAVFLFEGGRVTGVRIGWLFDDVFSDTVIQEHDRNHDGKFDAGEIADIEAHAFRAVKDFHYFTYLWVGGKMVEPIHVRDFTAKQVDGKLIYGFTVPLPQPVDPKLTRLQLEMYDETYFVQFDLAPERAVRTEGAAGAGCRGRVTKDQKRSYYGGFVVPDQITLLCGS
jgi:tRNA threonylcarbamoyladenosine biosynthesis protein TsaE